ncbi:MAG TPA: type II toxin-antitoxin system ParD family antitoxin [Vitreimonas sp.]|uniref:type II toxin-antitoxin system ParD family antitoxin n=1 Tax=Vitreimonas sp. TaxID=3069702 RepID=UPI002D53B86E|nr:type II toxin-antitoxin system ParD family antitoxin [Vitreimonas sp.]HYD88645.1 type II toxin-antitoxin system ParD family antitoxin [Vitreimonas sp.]
MATRNINLTPALDAYVAEQVASGQFQNASEVLRAGLRALKAEQAAHAAKVEALKAAIQVAEDDLAAGRYEDVEDIDAWMDEISAEVEAEFEAKHGAARTPAE